MSRRPAEAFTGPTLRHPSAEPDALPSETAILRETLALLSTLHVPGQPGVPACRVWRQHVGTFRHPYGPGAIVVGVKGMADIGGILYGGRALQVEIKAEEGRLRPEQRKWREMVIELGGLYIMARSPGFAVASVLEALGFTSQAVLDRVGAEALKVNG